VVIHKWNVVDFPDEYQLSRSLEELPLGEISQKPFSNRLFGVFVWFAFPLFLMCMSDLAWERYRKGRNLKKEY
jgi:hypothetical protein